MCTPAVLESGGDVQFFQDEKFSSSTSGDRSRKHPLEGIPYFEPIASTGLKSKARQRAKEQGHISFMTNCVVSLVKQLWSGKLNDDLVRAASNGITPWEEIKTTPDGVELGRIIRGKVSEIIKRRPTGFPKGAAAIRRQLGTELLPCPASAGAGKGTRVPKRGDIWPAEVKDISLPPDKTIPTYVGKASDKVEEYIKDFKTKMLKSPMEISKLRRELAREATEPYVDPNIKENMMELALRMALGGMLRGIENIQSTVGLFTVVKKVEEGGRVVLRLVLDQRIPNMFWQRPQWTPLSGPGAFGSIDLSSAGGSEKLQQVNMDPAGGPSPAMDSGNINQSAGGPSYTTSAGDMNKEVGGLSDHRNKDNWHSWIVKGGLLLQMGHNWRDVGMVCDT